ncbi:hypothetical protein MTP10_32985 [Nonomuraea sp. 3-1Str]|uniref:hypothetical protein n=1 Tax=Nonomuraea sp. 3-1Str TaxID=2929801 RepID=UPI0028583BA6|nr:hypothetical protein [Nonomuraea sp. 3-1Str]MDR8413540.1 hypothetical protein [Nonomuraea sp. 3-1Str]
MAELPGLRSPSEMRDYLVLQLNSVLRRPGMYGGEVSVRLVLDHLLHLEHSDEAWAEEQRALELRGAWTSTGVSGAFRNLIPGPYESGMTAVYSEFAHARGWLEADRTLTSAEYDQMRTQIPTWATRDRSLSEVINTFGPPSVLLGGNNPCYGKTLGYLTEPTEIPMIFFHLWNGVDPDAESTWPPRYDEAVLLAVHYGPGDFKTGFTFTPEGRKRRPTGI